MRTILVIALSFVALTIHAQSKKFTYSLQGITTVKIDTDTKIKIETNTSKELLISEVSNHDDDEYCGSCGHDQDEHSHSKKLEDKTKGLTAIYPGGKDDTNGFGLAIGKEGKTLIVTDLKSHMQRHGLSISLPKSMNIVVDTGNLGALEIAGFTSEVEAKTNTGTIVMKDVTGPITAHSNTGNITIEFSKVSQASPITVSTSVSEIDVTLPETTKANLKLNTRGTVYTNFDIEMPKKDNLKAVRGSQNIVSTLNKGGVQIKLKSSLGNIYLRKK